MKMKKKRDEQVNFERKNNGGNKVTDMKSKR